MPRRKMKVCDVTGIRTAENNFYTNQTHVKAVDNIRRTYGVSKDTLRNMFNTINSY